MVFEAEPVQAVLNFALLFGVVFLGLLSFTIARVRKLPKRKRVIKGAPSLSKNMLVLVLFSMFLVVVLTMIFTNYMVSAAEEDLADSEEDFMGELEQSLENSLQSVSYLAQKSRIDDNEIDNLRFELEQALYKLNEHDRPRVRVIYITPNGY